jgi:predicted GTPase
MNKSEEFHENLRNILEQLYECCEALDMPAESLRARTLASTIAIDRPAKLVVIGEFNSGKSTLVNALCGWSLLPAGITPTTATINVISHGKRPSICILRHDGCTSDLPFSPDALQQLTSHHGEHTDICKVRIEAPNVPPGLVLIDTPGVNDINQTRSELVYQMIPEADAILFLMDVQQPLKKSEVDFLRDRVLGSTMVKTVFVLNHIDRIASSIEIDSAIAYVRKNLSDVYGTVADSLARSGCEHLASEVRRYAADIPMFVVSAKKMLRSLLAGQDIDGDPMGLRAEVLGYAAPHAKVQILLSGALGQTAGIIGRLRKEVNDRQEMEGMAREQIVSALHQDIVVLRKTFDATQTAIHAIEDCRSELTTEAERTIDAVFTNAAAVLEGRVAANGLERGLQQVQQEIGRQLEGQIEALNERLRQLATQCTRQASAFIPLPAAKPRFEIDGNTPGEQHRDRLGELLSDPVNQAAFIVVAPLAALLFGWVGLAAVAFPFVARLFGSHPSDTPLAHIRSRIISSGQDVRLQVSGALSGRLDSIVATVLDILDEPQQRIRIGCGALCGGGQIATTTLAALSTRADQLDSQLGLLAAQADSRSPSGLATRLSAFGADSLKKIRAAVAMAVQ